MTPETTACLRCGGTRLIAAQVQNPMAFCVDHDAHHGVLHLGLRASLCEDCGHVELWVPDPSQIVRQTDALDAGALQEEDF